MDNEIILTDSPTEQQVDEHKYLKKVFFRVGLGFLLLNIVTGVAQTAIVELIASLSPSLLHDPFVYNAVSMLPIYLFGFPVLYLLTRKLRAVSPKKSKISLLSSVTLICVSFAAMSLGSRISNYIISFVDIFRSTSLQNPVESMTSAGDVLANILFLSICAPVLEELLFRKYLCQRLLPFGETVAIFASAAIFALVHGNLFQLFYAFLMGLVLGYAYVKYGKVRYTIAIHAIINFVGGVIPALVLDKILALTGEVTLDILLASLPYIIIFLLYTYYTAAFSTAGVAFIVINFKKIRIAPLPDGLQTKKTLKAALLNVGTILFLVYIIISYAAWIFLS